MGEVVGSADMDGGSESRSSDGEGRLLCDAREATCSIDKSA